MTAPHEFARQNLFEMVWSRPMTKLATELMISDVAIKKICVKHEVPVPGLGYWAKIAAGNRLERPKLSPASKPELETIRIYGSLRAEQKPEIREAEQSAKATESTADRKITVSERPHELHAVVQATLHKFKKEKPNEFGLVVTSGQGVFRVSVSSGQMDRSIRILNAITRASEERGFPVERGEDQSACLRVNGEQIHFRLRERIDRKPHSPTAAEAGRAEREKTRLPGSGESRPWWLPQWDYVPSGDFMLELEDHYYRLGLRRTYRDGRRRRLELLLNDFMTGMVAYAAAEKLRRTERERWQREWAEKEMRRIEDQQRIEQHKKRREFLEDRIGAFERAQKIDRFLESLASGPSETQSPGQRVSEFVKWARQYADRLKNACAVSEIDRALKDTVLFEPTTNAFASS